jgi:phospholipid/cholesterol/gamma-HCH transport system permease protein
MERGSITHANVGAEGAPSEPADQGALSPRGWIPAWLPALLVDAGKMVALLGATARAALTRPFDWRGECIDECAFILRRCLLPLAISAAALGFGAPGLQAGNFLNLLGTVDRLGAFFVLISVREIAPFLTGMIVAGVAGTAICADLGARTVRDEINAMRAMGMDPVRSLVVPRVVAMELITPLLLMFAILTATFGGYAAGVFVFGETSAGFFSTFASNFTTPDLFGAIGKTVLFAFVTATVACHMGLSVTGGPAGVGRAVNRCVVVSFVLIWIINYVVSSLVLGGFPETQALR